MPVCDVYVGGFHSNVDTTIVHESVLSESRILSRPHAELVGYKPQILPESGLTRLLHSFSFPFWLVTPVDLIEF